MSARVRLGELLVSAHIITREQLEAVLALQQEDGRRLGKLLVERGLVTETQLTQILSQQLSVPWVSLYHIDFSRQLLDLVPEELAEQHCLIPIFVRRVRGQGETLYIAMDDPTNEPAVAAVGEFARLPVRTMIAPPSDIRAAIRAYYASTSEEGEMLGDDDVAHAPSLKPSAPSPAPAPSPPPDVVPRAPYAPKFTPIEVQAVRMTPNPPSAEPSSLPPSAFDSLPPDESPAIEAREVSMPAPARRSRRMVTLTLLDGTQVNLPARTSRPPKEGEPPPKPKKRDPDESGGALTARDLVAALRAVSHGADASEILGDQARWEPLFAALLEVLLKKHVIADWEFVEEFRKI
jgi:type IV pilus assembly protein PilB